MRHSIPFVCIVLFYASTAAGSDCRSVETVAHFGERPSFTEADFPNTKLNSAWAARGAFSKWAARWATKSSEYWRNGASPREIFAEVARGRRALESRLVKKGESKSAIDEILQFGKPRTDLGVTQLGLSPKAPTLTFFSAALKARWALSKMRRTLARLSDSYGYPDSKDVPEMGYYAQERTLYYETSDTQKILSTKASRLKKGPVSGMVIVLHPPQKEMDTLMNDCEKRLGLAKNASRMEERHRQLSNAALAFFRAMPYERGSAAIGRASLSGIFSEILEKKIVLPDDVDFRAMVMPQEEFGEWLETSLFKGE